MNDLSLKNLVQLRRNLISFRDNTTIQLNVENIVRELEAIRYQSPETLLSNIDDILCLIRQVPYKDKIQNIINQIDARIEIVSSALSKISSDLTQFESLRSVVRKCFNIPPESEKYIQARIASHASWQYPALEIGPNEGQWTHLLQHAQPLVIADPNNTFIELALGTLPPIAKSRAVPHCIVDNQISLYHDQFGFIFSWDYFNYLPPVTIEDYLRQCFQLLRPGGTFIFSFNDCEHPACADMAENLRMHYYTSSNLTNVCSKIGYEKISTNWTEQHITWAEVSKPGILSTVKTHPVLGEIKVFDC